MNGHTYYLDCNTINSDEIDVYKFSCSFAIHLFHVESKFNQRLLMSFNETNHVPSSNSFWDKTVDHISLVEYLICQNLFLYFLLVPLYALIMTPSGKPLIMLYKRISRAAYLLWERGAARRVYYQVVSEKDLVVILDTLV